MWEAPISNGLRTWPSGLLQGSLDFLQGQAMICSAHSFPCQTEREDSLRHDAAPRRAGGWGSPGGISCFGELDLNFEPDIETVCCFKAVP